MTEESSIIDHDRFVRLLTNAEKLAEALDKYETADFNLISEEEIKTRFRTAASTVRFLGKAIVTEIEERHLEDSWDDIVPAYIRRHSH